MSGCSQNTTTMGLLLLITTMPPNGTENLQLGTYLDEKLSDESTTINQQSTTMNQQQQHQRL
jgi:hypothetical protein